MLRESPVIAAASLSSLNCARLSTATVDTLMPIVERALCSQVARGARLCVGLSGGVDSVVLLDLLLAIAPRHQWQIGRASCRERV